MTLRFIVPAFASLVVTLAGCAENPCNVQSKCSADPKLDEAEQSRCRSDLEKDPCKSELDAYLGCRNTKRVCGSDGKTDDRATAEACKDQNTKYLSCIGSAPITDGGT